MSRPTTHLLRGDYQSVTLVLCVSGANGFSQWRSLWLPSSRGVMAREESACLSRACRGWRKQATHHPPSLSLPTRLLPALASYPSAPFQAARLFESNWFSPVPLSLHLRHPFLALFPLLNITPLTAPHPRPPPFPSSLSLLPVHPLPPSHFSPSSSHSFSPPS